jgi:hypothetical protein
MRTEITWLNVGGVFALLVILCIAFGISPTPDPRPTEDKPRVDGGVSPGSASLPGKGLNTVGGAPRKPELALSPGLGADPNVRTRLVFRKLNRRRPPELEADPQFHKLLEIDSARKMALLQKEPGELNRVRQQLLSEAAIPRQVLEAALLDSNIEVRMAALFEISLATEEPPLDLLAAVLQGDPSTEVRLEALTIVADSDDEEADALIRSSLNDPDEAVRSEAREQVEARNDELP